MKVAVLSGKGGTGKTFITVNLAFVAGESLYIDCDVEEPNGHLFLKPEIQEVESVSVQVPRVFDDVCSECRQCVDFCKFNALAFIKNKVKVYKELCHSCGGCMLLCPEKAIALEDRMIGVVQSGKSKSVMTKTGVLNIGEASGVPIIRRLLEGLPEDVNVFVDCPPGSSCLVMESIKDADYCVLVTEPTIYGVHNTGLVYELVKLFNKPFGIVLNKVSDDALVAREFASKNNIHILAEFPYDAQIAKLSSEGELLAAKSEEYKVVFSDILQKIVMEVGHETTIHTKW
jgi:MinD superfamily P-loop ATPase